MLNALFEGQILFLASLINSLSQPVLSSVIQKLSIIEVH